MRAPGLRANIRSIASSPPIPGIDISITTTSGFTSGNFRQASSPLSDSSTTLISAEPSSSNLKPMRTTAWSSTSITLMFPIDLPSTALPLGATGRRSHRDQDRYGCSLSRRALNPEFTMECLDAFPHANKPKAHHVTVRLLAKSFAVVAHRHPHRIIDLSIAHLPSHCDHSTGCCSMSGDICETFLNRAIHGDIKRFTHSVELAFQPQIACYIRMSFAPRGNRIAQCITQSQVIERGRPKLPNQAVHHIINVRGN